MKAHPPRLVRGTTPSLSKPKHYTFYEGRGAITIQEGDRLSGKVASLTRGGSAYIQFTSIKVAAEGLLLHRPTNLRPGQVVEVRITLLRQLGQKPLIDLELVGKKERTPRPLLRSPRKT